MRMKADQAQRLREFLQRQNESAEAPTRVITIASGKGGVGKSNFVLNFALSLLEKNQKTVLIDLDLGMPNLDVLMGLSPRYNLFDMVSNGKSIWEIMEKGPGGLEYIAGGSGFQKFLNLDEEKLNAFFDELMKLQGYADVVLLDTGAGLSQESIRFILTADEVLLITTPEPTSLTDAYAVIKTVDSINRDVQFRLVVNRVRSEKEGKSTAQKLIRVAGQFLDKEIACLGYINEDQHVVRAVKQQQPFYLAYPKCTAAKNLQELREAFLTGNVKKREAGGMTRFVKRMLNFVK